MITRTCLSVKPQSLITQKETERLILQAELPKGSQTHFRSIVTDSFLRVRGSQGSIYAIGDAATIEQVYLFDSQSFKLSIRLPCPPSVCPTYVRYVCPSLSDILCPIFHVRYCPTLCVRHRPTFLSDLSDMPFRSCQEKFVAIPVISSKALLVVMIHVFRVADYFKLTLQDTNPSTEEVTHLQEKAVSRVGELFEKADLNNDGKLTLEELRIMMKDASKEYPHLEEHSRFLEG